MEFTEEEEVPEFIKKYIDAVHYEGYAEFIGVSREYKKDQDEYHTVIHPSRANQIKKHNTYTGDKRAIDAKPFLKELEEKYKMKALEIAKKHGYVEVEVQEPTGKVEGQTQEPGAKEPLPTAPQEPQAQLSERELKILKFRAAQQQIAEANKQRGNEIERD